MKKTNRQLAQQYRQHALELLARLGYATTRQLARSIFGSTTISKKKMVGRTLRWLENAGLIVSKRLQLVGLSSANSESIYALTIAGVKAARGLGAAMVADKAHARDYLRHAHEHRTACNSVFCAIAGAAFSEIEVRANEAPLNSILVDSHDFGEYRKIPDLIARTEDKKQLIWVEVENAYRSTVDLEKMLAAMRVMYQERERLRLSHVLFVIADPSAQNIGNRLRERLLHTHESGASVLLKNLDKAILESFVRVNALDPESLTLQPVAL